MNVLIIGSGGREHALALKLKQSPLLDTLFAAPGNPGIAEVATCWPEIDGSDHGAVIRACQANQVTFVVIGPEKPLVGGLADALAREGIAAFGPGVAAARLEGSKAFTKAFCQRHNIPTAAYAQFDSLADARHYVERMGAPIVVKADGLAAGKGVTVAHTTEDALAALSALFGAEPASSVVLEDVLHGTEASFFALCDGERALPFGSAQDHKRVGTGDVGPNTGGMGAFSPTPTIDETMARRIMAEIIEPTVAGMAAEGTPFRGVLFAGLMIDESGPRLIEFNVRFGDPETQAILPRLEQDLLPLLLACAEGTLSVAPACSFSRAAVTVVLAAAGYPGEVERGGLIEGLEAIGDGGVTVTQAGTALRDGKLVANGGRVLNITGIGDDLASARTFAYEGVDKVKWKDGFFRTDIAAAASKGSSPT